MLACWCVFTDFCLEETPAEAEAVAMDRAVPADAGAVAAGKAVTAEAGNLDVKICQMVKLMRDGEPVKMSKRAGQFITLREVVDEVGKDVVRFMMLTRKNDAPLEFDFVKVQEQSRDNPVFYVQYAHARICSVIRNASEIFGSIRDEDLANADMTLIVDPAEIALLKTISAFPRV